MQFVKYHGLGNDFIFIEDFAEKYVSCGPDLAAALCQRQFGIGADGLVLITRPQGLFTMRIFNSDGSEAEMCGNAIRCAAKHLLDRGLAAGDVLQLGTMSGPKEIRVVGAAYTVDMGPARWQAADVPFAPGNRDDGRNWVNRPVDLGAATVAVTAVSMGNPHAVVFVDDLDQLPFERFGPALERHPLFPQQTNAEFVQIVNRQTLRVKVWERGVGPTLACGTGACAAAAAAQRLDLVEDSVAVDLPGGRLDISLGADGHFWMKGPAERVFFGEIEHWQKFLKGGESGCSQPSA